jgi:hypothetical protein
MVWKPEATPQALVSAGWVRMPPSVAPRYGFPPNSRAAVKPIRIGRMINAAELHMSSMM